MKVGIVDLDTSHPGAWIPILREMGHEIVGVWDGGSVHPARYAREFAAEHGVGRVYDSLEEMVDETDCAIIHGCDWDTHVSKARPFVEAHKAVLVDKPLAGNLRDLEQMQRWEEQGARITGGSALRFCDETRQFLDRPAQQRGIPHTVFCGCAVDDFNYGVHAYALLCGILGPGVVSVRHLREGVQRRIQLNWGDGRMGIVVIGAAKQWIPFYASIVTDQGVTQFTVDGEGVHQLYQAFLEAVLPYLQGAVGGPPLPMKDLVEPELCALAAKHSWTEGDRPVRLDELRDECVSYDGMAFAAQYRAAKYPGQS